MKKLTFILCFAIMAISFASCSSTDDGSALSSSSVASAVSNSDDKKNTKAEDNTENKNESSSNKSLIDSNSTEKSTDKVNNQSGESTDNVNGSSTTEKKSNENSGSASNSQSNNNTSSSQIELPTFNENDFNNPVSRVVGKWKLSHYENEDGSQVGVNVVVEYYFKNNGTLETRVNGHRSTATYKFDGTNINYTADASGETGRFIYDSEKDLIYDQQDADLAKAVIVRQ